MNKLNKIEKQIEGLNAMRDSLEQKLSDNSIYDVDNRDKLNSSLAAQAENSKLLMQAEDEWLSLSEIIELQSS